MQRNLIYELCSDPTNNSLTILQFPKERKRPILITQSLSTIPNFDSNSSYVVIQQRHNCSILNDEGYHSFKIFFWIGSRCLDYEQNYQEVVFLTNDLSLNIPKTKLRIYLEFQYSESFQFFSLFKRQDLAIERVNEIAAIQYQDFQKANTNQKALAFPKILVLEIVKYPMEYQKFNVRIYEKKDIDTKIQSSLVYMYLQGSYQNQDGKVIDAQFTGLTASDELRESLTQVDVHFGSKVNFTLIQFTKKLLANYRKAEPNIVINETRQKGESISGLWQELEEKALFINTEIDTTWPNEKRMNDATKYPYPYRISNDNQWTLKPFSERDKESLELVKDSENVLYNIEDEFNVIFKKKEGGATNYLDENESQNTGYKKAFTMNTASGSIELYRVSLEQSELAKGGGAGTRRAAIGGGATQLPQFKKEYEISFQKLNLKSIDSTMMGNTQIYLVSSPYTLFLWFGSELDPFIQRGALHILKTFLNSQLNDSINYQPSYFDSNQNVLNVKFRVEQQYYESQRFRSYFDKSWYEDKLDYLMMRIQKQDSFQGHEKVGKDITVESGDHELMDFDMLADLKAQQDGRVTIADMKRESEFKKQQVNTTSITKKSGTVTNHELQGTSKESEVEALSLKYDQERFIKVVKSNYNPLSIVNKSKANDWRAGDHFDQLTIYQIMGNKFEQIDSNNSDFGIFDSNKSYFIVLTKFVITTAQKFQAKNAISLWRGSEQKTFTLAKSMNQLQETEFRPSTSNLKSHDKRRGTVQLDQSFTTHGEEHKNGESLSEQFELVDKEHLDRKGTLMNAPKKVNFQLVPFAKVKATTSSENFDETKVSNMKSQLDESGKTCINMRTLVCQDNEPLHLLQAFQGQIIIKTNDYLKRRHDTTTSDDQFGDSTYIMLFQLIGVPALNQKAREVPPFYDSLTTSGLYILLTKQNVFYWIGQEYFNNYLDDSTYNKQNQLISESLLARLYKLYEQTSETEILEQQIFFCLEGKEHNLFFKVLNDSNDYGFGDDDDLQYERSILKYESSFLKKYMIPQEPRLYCLIFNSNVVEYDDGDTQQKSENEAIVFKEIHNFNQKSLDQKGVFLLDFYSESFVWVGKKVQNKDKVYTLQLAYQVLRILHKGRDYIERMTISQVESGYEPEIFKEVFIDGWQNYEHYIEEEVSSEEEGKENGGKSPKSVPALVPESYWLC